MLAFEEGDLEVDFPTRVILDEGYMVKSFDGH